MLKVLCADDSPLCLDESSTYAGFTAMSDANYDGVIQLPLDSCRFVCALQGVKQSSVENADIFLNFRPLKIQTINI